MKNVALACCFVAVLGSSLFAQGEAKKKKNGDPAKRMVETLLKGLEPAELKPEQTKEIEEMYSKVAKEVVAKRAKAKLPGNIFKLRADAQKEAKEAGKKGKALQAAIDAKIGLTEEQSKCWAETTEMLAKTKLAIGKLLSEEQLAKVEKPLQTALTGKTGAKKKNA
ncbi:MAG: hypothetical protein KDB22_02195 [Planctomycetales bacterium]|nr:hypothetical protein [Planctomycetales bacterium]